MGVGGVVAADDGRYADQTESALLGTNGLAKRSRVFEIGCGGRWIYRFPTNPTSSGRLSWLKIVEGVITHPLTLVFVPDSALGLLPSIALSSGQAAIEFTGKTSGLE
jgi:hypothetical protein